MKNFLRYFYGVQFIVLFIIIKGIFKKKKKDFKSIWMEGNEIFFSYSNDRSIYDPFSLRDRYIKSENDATWRFLEIRFRNEQALSKIVGQTRRRYIFKRITSSLLFHSVSIAPEHEFYMKYYHRFGEFNFEIDNGRHRRFAFNISISISN